MSLYKFYNMPITLNDTNISVQYGNTDNQYIIFKDLFTSTSNLTAEPYLESEERPYPPSRLFTTNNLTLTNQYYVSIACGNSHTIFLTNEGRVYSCGLNTSGQLGRTADATNPTTVPSLITTETIGGTPTAFNTLTISAIACGANHTMFLTNDGEVYSCGYNAYGELGRTGITTTSVPGLITTTTVRGTPTAFNNLTISAIACGSSHTIFLTNTYNVYGCGANYGGQLGITTNSGTYTATPNPTLITSSVGGTTTAFDTLPITAIACGDSHTVFLDYYGQVYSCGHNLDGQLGITTNLGSETATPNPTLITTTTTTVGGTTAFNNLTITAIACGYWHTVFLTYDGMVYSCGLNTDGQLGRTGTTTVPGLINTNIDGTSTAFNTLTISAIACGRSHTVFLTNDGKVYGCGSNEYGQLGLPLPQYNTPQPIPTLNSLTISAISCGVDYTIFITNIGKIYCCGNNDSGKLGISIETSQVAIPSIVNTFPSSCVYGSGLYTVSYSSFTPSYEPYRCFNDNPTDNTTNNFFNNPGTWRTGDYLSTGLFDSTTYNTSNLVSGYNGDWLVIKLPVSIKLKRFVIKQISSDLISAPRNFRLYGSTNGTSWTLLIDKQDAVYTSLLYNHTDMSQYASDTNKYYNHFGLVVNALVGSSTTLSFDEFYVYGVELLTYNLITNGNTKTLTIPSINILKSNLLNSYNITFPVLTYANIRNDSNLILEGEYGINRLSSWRTTIVPKSSQYIPSSVAEILTFDVSILYSLINPIKDIKGKYIIETVKSDLFIPDLVTSTSNLTAEPYLESGERSYPPSRLFTTNDLTLTNQYYESIACGYYHTIFLTNDGKVYSCGKNDMGQLGRTGTTTTPELINTNILNTSTPFNTLTIISIASAGNHTIFLTNEGKVYSCGSNGYGVLGRTGTTTVPGLINTTTVGGTPTAFNNLTISAIACGDYHTVNLTNDGKVYSYGRNSLGQLGITTNSGTDTGIQNPTLITTTTVGGTTTAFNNLTISAIACGNAHTVFLTNEGKVYSCGDNSLGQLGITTNLGTSTATPNPTLITTNIGTLTISAIACGLYHTVFLTNDGKVYSCGYSDSGRLGRTGTTSVPGLINTNIEGTTTAFDALTITAIACGDHFTFFIANDGKVYSCGQNTNGQLGRTGTTTVPGLVTQNIAGTSTAFNTLTIAAIASGQNYSLFLTNEGKIYSCGLNTNGQLGLGNTTSTTVPSIVNTFPSSSIYGSGLYTVSYSSFTSSFEPFKCFNENSTANNQGTWRSGDYLSTGLFNSATYSTSNLVSGYNGDWLVIKLPLSIKLKRFAIKQLSTALNSAPRNFRLYGSTTGTSLSWTLLIDKQDAVYTSLLYNHTDMSQYASDTNKYYNHFGLVVNAILGSATTLSFDEFFVYGIESVPYTPITNGNTKTLTTRYNRLNNTFLNSYNITFPVITIANINNNSNLFLQGEYGINLINSTSNTIVPKSGQFIPPTASSLNTSTVSISYSLINPIKDIKGAQWTYNSLNTSVYHMGNVGIGTTNPNYELDVRGNIYSSTGGITQSGLTTWTVRSDRRIKENIVKASYEKCLDNVKNIELYNFNFKDNYVSTNDRHQLGFIAQEVQTVYPKAVEVNNITLNTGYTSDVGTIENILTLNTTQIKYTLYGAVKKLIEKIEDIEMRVEKLYISTISSNIDIDNNE